MNIEIKGINDVLVIKVNNKCSFDAFLSDLSAFLDQPIFQQDGYYPRAFFDFNCRQLEENDLIKLISLLKQKKKILFDGFQTLPNTQNVSVFKNHVRNGQEIYLHKETLFLGSVNPGGYIYCYGDVYFLNSVKGNVVMMNEGVHIYGRDFEHAQIIMNQEKIHDLTTSALISVYYEDNQLKMNGEGIYEQNNSHYIR